MAASLSSNLSFQDLLYKALAAVEVTAALTCERNAGLICNICNKTGHSAASCWQLKRSNQMNQPLTFNNPPTNHHDQTIIYSANELTTNLAHRIKNGKVTLDVTTLMKLIKHDPEALCIISGDNRAQRTARVKHQQTISDLLSPTPLRPPPQPRGPRPLPTPYV